MTLFRKAKSARRILVAACAAVLGGGTAASATELTWSGANANNSLWSTATNWIGNTAPVAHDSLVFDGFARLTPNNDFAANTPFDGITFAASAGAFNLVGNQLTLAGDINDNTPVLTQTIGLAMLLDGDRNVGITDNGSLTLGGPISGIGFGITKTGNGTLLLNAANTFTGTMRINAGVVSVSSDANLGGADAGANRLTIDGGILRTTANITIDPARGIALGNAGGGGGTFDVQSGTTLTYGGVIGNNGGSGGLTKLSFGNMVLSGINTYTGPTSIKNGGLTLNFAAAGAPLTNIISSNSHLTLGGANAGLGGDSFASLTMSGAAGVNNVQTFNGTTIDIGLNRIIATRGAAPGTATLNLGALTHNVGSHLAFSLPTSNSGVINTTTPSTNGILGGWAVVGTGTVQRGIMAGTSWASVDASGNIVPYTAYTPATPYDAGNVAGTVLQGNVTAADNVRLAAAVAPEATEVRVAPDNANATVDINTWAWENVPTTATTGHALTIGSGNTLRLGVNGGIFRQATTNNRNFYVGSAVGGGIQTGSGTSGSQNVGNLTAGGPNADTPGEIVATVNNDSETSGSGIIEARIVDNGTGAVTFVKAGSGALKIDGNNTYSGGTYIIGGRLQLAGSELGTNDSVNPARGNPDGLGTGPVYIMPGGQLFASGINPDLTNASGPGSLNNFDNITPSANDAIIANPIFLAGIGTNQESIGAIRLGNRSNMTGQITLTGDGRIGGGNGPTFNLNYPTRTELTVTQGNLLSGKITGKFNMDFGNGSGANVGTDATITNQNNDWTGNTTLVGRTGAAANTRLRLGNDNVIPDGVGKGNVQFGNPNNTNSVLALDLMGFSETINGLSTDPSANVNNDFIENNGFGVSVDTSAGANAYAYVFTPTTSTLTVGNYDATATFAGTIRDNDPSITYTLPNPNWNGSADPTTANGPDADGDPTTLTITNPATTAGSVVALTKIGAGIQTLSGVNTYTGDTNINNGTLAILGQLAQNGKVKINSSASSAGTLSGTGIVGDVTMAATVGGHKATIAPGTTGAVGSIGTLSLNSLTVNGGDIAIDVGQGNSDVIVVATNTTFAAPSTISPGPSGAAGTYTILQSGNPIVYTSTPTLVAPDLTRSTFSLDTTSNPNAINLIVTGGSKSLNWTGASNGKWDIVGFQNWADSDTLVPERFFNGDAVTFGDVNTNRNLTLDATALPSSVTFTNSSASDYTLSGVGGIGGSANLSKSGNGQVTISTNNTYSGTTVINEGTIQVGTGGTAGSLGSGNITNNGSLIFNRSDNITIGQTIDGNGGLRKQGAGTMRLNGINSYSGATTIEQGTIIVNNSQSLGNTPGGGTTINSGGALDLSGDGTANDLNFQSNLFTIAGSGVNGTGALTNSGNTAQQNAFQNITLSADATVGGTGRFDLRVADPSTPGILDLAGHTLTKVGTNQVTLVNASVTDGNIVVNEGTFAIEASTSIPDNGTGKTITYNAGTTMQFFGNVRADGAPGSPVLRPMVLNGGVTTGNASNAVPATIGSNITLGGDLTVAPLNNANNATLTLLGNISETGDARSLIKNGATTTLILSGASTYSGGTKLNAGTLTVNNTAGSATGSGPLTMGDNTTLTGNGTIGGTVTASGTAHIAPGDGIATLTFGGLGLAEGTTLDFEGNGATFDQINLTGTNTLSFAGNAVMNLVELGQLNEGSFTLINYNGTPIGDLTGKLTLANNVLSGLNATLFDDSANTAIKIKLENPNGAPQWFVDADGSWTTPGNWNTGIVPDGANNGAAFLGVITAPRTVTLDGDRTIGSLAFDNANKYTIAPGSGGTLTIGDDANGGSISVATGSHEISAPVTIASTASVDVDAGAALAISGGFSVAAGKSLTKSGDGTLQISGPQSHGAGASLTHTQGTLQLDSNAGTANSAAGSNLSLTVAANASGAAGKVLLNSDQDLKELNISYQDSGTQTLDLNSPAGSGLFHAVRVYASDLNGAKIALSAAVRNANATGAPDKFDGIIDSDLHAGSGIGVGIVGDHVLIRPTKIGDLNLDGSVTISDFIDLASNFNGTNKTWQEGDLNNDGNVTISDFIDLASNFNSSYSGTIGAPSAADFQTLASFASSVGVDPAVIGSAVPEPASLGLLMVGGIGLMRRRRRA